MAAIDLIKQLLEQQLGVAQQGMYTNTDGSMGREYRRKTEEYLAQEPAPRRAKKQQPEPPITTPQHPTGTGTGPLEPHLGDPSNVPVVPTPQVAVSTNDQPIVPVAPQLGDAPDHRNYGIPVRGTPPTDMSPQMGGTITRTGGSLRTPNNPPPTYYPNGRRRQPWDERAPDGTLIGAPKDMPMFGRGGKLREGENIVGDNGPEIAIKHGKDTYIVPIPQTEPPPDAPADVQQVATQPVDPSVQRQVLPVQVVPQVSEPTPQVSGPPLPNEQNRQAVISQALPGEQPYQTALRLSRRVAPEKESDPYIRQDRLFREGASKQNSFGKRFMGGMMRGLQQGGLLGSILGGVVEGFSPGMNQQMRTQQDLRRVAPQIEALNQQGEFDVQQKLKQSQIEKNQRDAAIAAGKQFLESATKDDYLSKEEAKQYEALTGYRVTEYDAREYESKVGNDGKTYHRPKKGGGPWVPGNAPETGYLVKTPAGNVVRASGNAIYTGDTATERTNVQIANQTDQYNATKAFEARKATIDNMMQHQGRVTSALTAIAGLQTDVSTNPEVKAANAEVQSLNEQIQALANAPEPLFSGTDALKQANAYEEQKTAAINSLMTKMGAANAKLIGAVAKTEDGARKANELRKAIGKAPDPLKFTPVEATLVKGSTVIPSSGPKTKTEVAAARTAIAAMFPNGSPAQIQALAAFDAQHK